MNLNKKRSPKSSLYFHLIAGLYLLYIDYSMISNWQDIEEKNKIIMIVVALVFAISACLIIINALKGLKKIKEIEAVEEIEEIEEIEKLED